MGKSKGFFTRLLSPLKCGATRRISALQSRLSALSVSSLSWSNNVGTVHHLLSRPSQTTRKVLRATPKNASSKAGKTLTFLTICQNARSAEKTRCHSCRWMGLVENYILNTCKCFASGSDAVPSQHGQHSNEFRTANAEILVRGSAAETTHKYSPHRFTAITTAHPPRKCVC